MSQTKIVTELFRMQDKPYAAFQAKLLPSIDPDTVIGVRTPQLREFAKELYKIRTGADTVRDGEVGKPMIQEFLTTLPHHYFEENQLHAFLISLEKDFDTCVTQVEAFLPNVDNWATCDQMSPKAFKKQPEKLLPYINRWIASDRTYTVRFAVGMLMEHFLDGRFDAKYAEMVAQIRSDEYYINMMIAWYFATALAKQYEAVLPYLEQKRLAPWTHNRAIQKSIESYRITDEQKAYLRTLKVHC